MGDVLEVGQLGDDAGKRGGCCCEEHVERLKRGMARRLTCQIGSCAVANPFKTILFVERGLVIAVSFSVGFDQAEHRVVPGNRWRRPDGDGLRDVIWRSRGEGKGCRRR